MGDGYTKLFSDIVDSSIWDEDAETRIVWVTLLALSNADGLVRGSIGWLAAKSRVSQEACRKALVKFAAPDPQSRTPDNDGRRIEPLDDGWLILNYLIFRDRLSTNPKAVKTRERVRKHRERYNALHNVTCVTPRHSASDTASVSDSGTVDSTPKIEWCLTWLLESNKAGSDYTEAEARGAFLALSANGWMWGKNPVADWRSALERQI